MNRRQTIVMWIMAVALSLLSIGYGVDWDDPFYTFAVPILLLGGMLLFQFRDRGPGANSHDSHTLRSLAAAIVLLQLILLAHEVRAAEGLSSAVSSVDEKVDRAADDLTSLQGELAECR